MSVLRVCATYCVSRTDDRPLNDGVVEFDVIAHRLAAQRSAARSAVRCMLSLDARLTADELGDSDHQTPLALTGRSRGRPYGMVSVPTRITVNMPSTALTFGAEL